jgi:hypothetical protein
MNIFKPSGTFAPAAGADNDVAERCARYTPAHLDKLGFNYLRDLGFPGEHPFTRGDRAVVPTEFDMSRSKS